MPGPTFLRGETVELRTLEPDDAEAMQAIVNDPAVRAGIGRVEPVSEPQEREWLEAAAEDDGVHLAICVDDELVGTIGFENPHPQWRTAEVGYFLREDAWGNGYATDALATLCAFAFDEYGLAKLAAKTFESNAASQRVLEKVGFEREGVHRSAALVDGEREAIYHFGLLREEFDGR